MRAIDADKLKRKAQKVATEAWKMKLKAPIETILNQFIDWIDEQPTIQFKQQKGKWIPSDSQCGIQCSACGVPVDDFCHSIDYIDLDYEPNFCPNCGLKMEGASEWMN